MNRIERRLQDILTAVERIELLLSTRSFVQMESDPIGKAAFERFLEVISEASRHIPEDMKQAASDIPWKRVADMGNHLRHGYSTIDAKTLWDIYASGELNKLKGAVEMLLSQRSDT